MKGINEEERTEGRGKKGGTQGAEVVVGGNRDGAVFYPTILKNVNEDMKVMCEKVFAPVISIVPYINVDEVFARFNDSNFGLQAGIFTSELHLAMRATHELDFGGVNINDVSIFRADILSYGESKIVVSEKKNQKVQSKKSQMKKSPNMRLFEEATKNMGLHPYMQPAANLTERYTNPDGITRGACQYSGFCERFACRFGAKATPLVTVLPVAEETGKFELHTFSNVTRILHDENGKATGVLYTDLNTGEEFEQPADVVALTSYVFNNVRLLLLLELGKAYNSEDGTGSICKSYAYQIRKGAATGFFDEKKFNFVRRCWWSRNLS